MEPSEKNNLSHLDETGRMQMVDVSHKDVSAREAVATAEMVMEPSVLVQLLAGGLKKGDAVAVAKVAGITAAKRTGELIPLCHPLGLAWVGVEIEAIDERRLRVTSRARATARTGVEMEALVAASVAALTLYDMAKAGDRSITIGPIQLEEKAGGKSGPYRRGST